MANDSPREREIDEVKVIIAQKNPPAPLPPGRREPVPPDKLQMRALSAQDQCVPVGAVVPEAPTVLVFVTGPDGSQVGQKDVIVEFVTDARVGSRVKQSIAATDGNGMATCQEWAVLREGVHLVLASCSSSPGVAFNAIATAATALELAPPGPLTLTSGGDPTSAKAFLVDGANNRFVAAAEATTWQSGNTAVATVDSGGKITAVAPGNAAVKAVAQGHTAQIAVTVVV